jgi:hypothetical protein
MVQLKRSVAFLFLMMILAFQAFAGSTAKSKVYYFDAENGNDKNSGLSIETPLKSISHIKSLSLKPGDVLLLKRGSVFNNQSIELISQKGTTTQPIRIESYGSGNKPKIDLGELQQYAIQISASEFLEIKDIEITGGSGGVEMKFVDSKTEFSHFVFKNLHIHDCYSVSNGSGFLINITPRSPAGKVRMSGYKDIRIEDCEIDMIVRNFIHGEFLNGLEILNNNFKNSGGPGIVIKHSNDLTFMGNQISSAGSLAHESFRGRGSCAWIIGCKDVLVENNIFENARGWLDSYGFHLDIGNSNVIVQRNLSRNNAGGFIQLLGKNTNSVYRYNISINDGWRVKGVFDHPEEKNTQDGCVINLYGYVANGTYAGPFNTYIYNNTVYVNDSITAGFNFRGTVKGVFIANNVFHITGDSKEITVFKSNREPESTPENIIFKNNVYYKPENLPSGMRVDDSHKIIGDAGFAKAGGNEAVHYIPMNKELLKDRSILITKIPGDKNGVKSGFNVNKDFFGNPIVGIPDLGAIELK